MPGIYGDPIGLVGGVAPKSGVYLVSVRADFRLGGSAVLRSVDDGQTWTQVLAFQGGVGGGVTNWTDLPDVSDPGKLAFDPDHPEDIILGPTRASADGGSQWGSIADINLADVATTSNGVFGATVVQITPAGQ